jgi:hypothetical protein
MSKYRFRTKEEFKDIGKWDKRIDSPVGWNTNGDMNVVLGEDIDDEWIDIIENHMDNDNNFKIEGYWYHSHDFILNEPEMPIEQILEQINLNKSLITKEKQMNNLENVTETATEKFVFMDKTDQVLNIGFNTCKNIVLYGPGGHGKSEKTLDFLKERGIQPYVITMGTGMTTDRLFGGMNILKFNKTGKIEYLVENSFMDHEYVVFEEMFDAPDFILEQLKDILSSGVFRNGTQVYPIKTKFIICCTNRTRDEFSKNMSLRALMERFPLELNVIWDNYTEISYNKLLESKFGVDNVDPVIPYLLQEYAKNGITISPRIAVTAYSVYDQCGPEALSFIAEFTKKPALIAEAIKTFEGTIKFRQMSGELTDIMSAISETPLSTRTDETAYKIILKSLTDKLSDLRSLTVNDDLVSMHTQLVKAAVAVIDKCKKNLQIAQFI